MLTLAFEMLAKHNEEVLVPVDDDGNFIVKKKQYMNIVEDLETKASTTRMLVRHLLTSLA